MTPYHADDAVQLFHGDCLDVLRELPDASVDAVVTDPPYGLEFMGREWDGADGFRRSLNLADAGRDNAFGRASRTSPEYRAGTLFQQWCELWAAECLRVLRPGGHMLAFGGTRTWHRLACAVEDAGFEIRDSIAWLYGSGFPKSLDVSKAIDRATGAEREVVGMRPAGKGIASGQANYGGGASVYAPENPITSPATAAAATWQGWGTALKPAWESVVVARKAVPLYARIGSRLDGLELACRPHANGAGESSAPTPHGSPEAKTGSAPANAATRPEDEAARTTPTGGGDGSSARTATSASGSTAETCWNIVTSWRRCWADLSEPTSTSTTETTSSTTTDLATLWSCLSKLTDPSTLLDPTSPDGLSSHARAADALFAAAWLSWSATRTLTATEPATSPTPPASRAGGASRLEPIVVARKPLTGTVAQNVLAHGTGALNIDGCRIGTTETLGRAKGGWGNDAVAINGDGGYSTFDSRGITVEGGRWPANVVLDQSQAAQLDKQSGTLKSPGSYDYSTPDTGNDRIYGSGRGVPKLERREGFADTGGASRFFYVPKAPTDQRPRVPKEGAGEGRVIGRTIKRCRQCGNQTIRSGAGGMPACGHDDPENVTIEKREEHVAHPTVKPVDLIRWLVRLVTPPGGLVLDPFAGSGTTGEACIIEGFRCVLVEREAEYLPLIVARVTKPIQPDLFGGAA